jgi:hypothetical protein
MRGSQGLWDAGIADHPLWEPASDSDRIKDDVLKTASPAGLGRSRLMILAHNGGVGSERAQGRRVVVRAPVRRRGDRRSVGFAVACGSDLVKCDGRICRS